MDAMDPQADQYREFSKDDPNELEGFVDWKGRPALKDLHGGTRATIFVYVMEGFDNVAFLANAANLVTYFTTFMLFDLAESANSVTNFMGTAFMLALVGGFVSDAYINRFKTNIIFGSLELVGYIILTIQAHYPSLKPAPCNVILDPTCQHVKGGKAAMLFTGLYLVALGNGGVKAALPSHGADQFDERDPKERRQISTFFNWFLFSLCLGSTLGVTVVVWVQNNRGWDRGFGISTAAIFLGILSLIAGMTTYRNRIPGGSPLARIVQVFVAAINNHNRVLPENPGSLYEVQDKEAGLQLELLPHTQQFKFLDKAAIPPNENSSEMENKMQSPWRLCTVTQIEEVKVLVRMAPVFASTILMNTCLAQLQTFSVTQGITMDTQMGPNFKIPPASLPVIPLAFMVLLTPVYDRIFVPFARRITGHETGITHLQRVGVGLVLSAMSMGIAALVEVKRKNVATEHGMLDAMPILQPLPISVFWLGFQYFIFGIADLFTFVGLMEFFYSQAPIGMRSLATAFSWCSLALCYFLSSVLVDIVNAATSNNTRSHGWLHGNNLNRNHLNLFYWTLAILSMLNFCNYLYWSSWYKYKPIVHGQVADDASTIHLAENPKNG